MSDAIKDEIFVTQDGSHSISAAHFGVSYHSKYGAITESRHVFIQAGLFPLLLKSPEKIAVLEMGFGTGLNALLTLHEILNSPTEIHYEAFEAYPIGTDIAQKLNYPQLIDVQDDDLKLLFEKMHRMPWEEKITLTPQFSLIKKQGKLEEQLFTPQFDLIYYDAFAPSSQPELWDASVMQKMHDALKPGGVLVTYCAKGEFKRTLKQVGFLVEPLPGPPGKREMTKAIKESA